MIHHEAQIGKTTKLWYPELSNIGACTIGEHCKIHSHVWIGDGVLIGNRVCIEAFSFIPPGVVIEDDVFVGPRTTFTNDKYPPSHKTEWKQTRVGKDAVLCADVTILPGCNIGEKAFVCAKALVTHEVPAGVRVLGIPAREIT